MSALVLWIVGIVWFIGVPSIIWTEERGADRVLSFAIWGAITAAFFTGQLMWAFSKLGGV